MCREGDAAAAGDHEGIGGARHRHLLLGTHQDVGDGDRLDLFRARRQHHQNVAHLTFPSSPVGTVHDVAKRGLPFTGDGASSPTDDAVQEPWESSMRNAAIAILSLLLAGGSMELAAAEGEAAPAPAVDDLIQRVLAAQRGVTSISGRYTQRTVRLDDPEQAVDVYHARFDLLHPDKYNIIYTKPGDDEYRQRYCSDGRHSASQVQIMAGVEPDTVVHPVAAGNDDAMANITALFRLDPVAIARDFTIAPEARGEAWTVVLVPRTPGLAEKMQRIEVDLDPSLRTKSLRIDDARGNRILITIEEAVYNPTLPPETFTVPAP